jgi:RNA polymerase sigma factor (sigma-70 family)
VAVSTALDASWTDAQMMTVLANPEAANGSRQHACTLLVERYYQVMLERALAILPQRLRDLAEDVAQEVTALFVGSAKATHFDTDRPLEPWLLRVVANKARDLVRQETRHCLLGDVNLYLASADDLSKEVSDRDQVDVLFLQLTTQEQTLARLFYLEERAADDVAHQLGCRPKEVYKDLHRVRGKLRKRSHPPLETLK